MKQDTLRAIVAEITRVGFPQGAVALGALGFGLMFLGTTQLLARDPSTEPWPLLGSVLAGLLLGGGVILSAFVGWNVDMDLAGQQFRLGPRRTGTKIARQNKLQTRTILNSIGVCTLLGCFIALLLVGVRPGEFLDRLIMHELPYQALRAQGNMSPSQLASPLASLFAGSLQVAAGSVAVSSLIGGLWAALHALGGRTALGLLIRSAIYKMVQLPALVPYVVVVVLSRALLCGEVMRRAAFLDLSGGTSAVEGFVAQLGMTPGLLLASVSLGLPGGAALWSWLERHSREHDASDASQLGRLAGRPETLAVLRDRIWLRNRGEFAAILLTTAASAVLVDLLSNSLVDAMREPGSFPLYPSLGSVAFLMQDPATLTLPIPAVERLHMILMFALLCFLLATAPQLRPSSIALKGNQLYVNGRPIARAVPGLSQLVRGPQITWLIGPSGGGKSSLLLAFAQPNPTTTILVPQDPDKAFPSWLSGAELSWLCAEKWPNLLGRLRTLLDELDDSRLAVFLSDPFTPVAALSRGERQRLAVAMAIAAAGSRDAGEILLMLDEPSAAQDDRRGAIAWRQLSDLVSTLARNRTTTLRTVVVTHDPTILRQHVGARSGTDDLYWLPSARGDEPQPCQVIVVRSAATWEDRTWEPTRVHDSTGQLQREPGDRALPPEVARYREALDKFGACWLSAPAPSTNDALVIQFGRDPISMGAIRIRSTSSAGAPLGYGGLTLLHGASGSGKSTLLRWLARGHLQKTSRPVIYGYIPQEPARALPAAMPILEAAGFFETHLDRLRPELSLAKLGELFGADELDEILQEGGLDRTFGTLSEGQRQRLVLARELLRLDTDARRQGAAALLLLDEPFAALEPVNHLRLLKRVCDWLGAGQNRAALLVTHHLDAHLAIAQAYGVDVYIWTMNREESRA